MESKSAQQVAFFSDGDQLVGDLLMPTELPGPSIAGVVVSPGWGSLKDRAAGNLARRLADAGFAALVFDYRGYGQSEGKRGRLFPHEQAMDIRSAVAFLRSVPGIDPDRIGVLSLLTGAGSALVAAGEDSAIRAVVGLFAVGDGGRWLRSLRSHWQWLQFVRRLDADRRQRSLTGVSQLVDPNEILPRDPAAMQYEDEHRRMSQARREWKLGLDSADAIINFRPEAHVGRLGPRAVMLVSVADDAIAPFEEAERLYARLSEPKRILVLRGIAHHEIYRPEILDGVVANITAFLNDFMAVDGGLHGTPKTNW